MKKNSLKVALNMTTLSVPEKIRKATAVVDALTNNASVFATPNPDLKDVSTAIDDLNAAYMATSDGGKSKTAVMHDMENALMKLMNQLAAYVEQMADDDDAIVHLAGLDVKKHGARIVNDFSVIPVGSGQVTLQVKTRKDAIYKWQYSSGNSATPAWVDALYSKVSKASIQGLSAGLYLFRVVFIDATGEHAGSTLSVAVN